VKNLKLNPEKIEVELSDFKQKLQKSYQALKEVQQIDVAQSEYEVIFTQDKLRLLYFPGNREVDARCKTPLLITYALVNRWYMIDLEPERSLLKSLISSGQDTYVIDWGYPEAADRFLDLDDYINEYLNNCVDQVTQHSGANSINLLGICQGGTLSLCYSAIYPKKIKNLITMVTPVDFHTPDNTLSLLARYIDTDLAVSAYGNIPGELLNDAYKALMPMRLGVQKSLDISNYLDSAQKALSFLRMEKWIYDSPNQAGEAFKQFIRWFFQENKLVNNEIIIGDKPVNLNAISQPILNIYGAYDHLVPPSASLPLGKLVNSNDYQALEVKAGHIGVFVSTKAQRIVPKAITEWLMQRD